MALTEQVFVYGTLRPPLTDTPAVDSRYYPQIAAYVQAAVSAQLLAGQLYNLGTYPGVVAGEGVVQGDLLTVTPLTLEIMDRIEGHPSFYRRQKVEVQSEAGPTSAWIYWAPKGMVLGRPRISNGDWLRRHEAAPDSLEAVYDSNPPPDETLQALVKRFADSDCMWLSCVRPDGRAHSSPIWQVWYQGRAYVVTKSEAVKTKNILYNPSVVMTHPDPVDPIIIEGWATLAPTLEANLQPLFKAKHDWDISTDREYNTIIEITPTRFIAWGKYGEGRWPGEEVLRIWLADS